MKCQQAEKLIIASAETDLDPKIRIELDAHVAGCAKCAGLYPDVSAIYAHLRQLPERVPAEQLSAQTRALCHGELVRQIESGALTRTRSIPVTTSRWLLLVLIGLVVLTGVVVVPICREFIRNYSVPDYAVIGAIVLMQNVLMLLFAPILLRPRSLKISSDHVVLNGV